MNETVEIVYSDDDIVIAVKPAGINSTDIPGGMPELVRKSLTCSDIRTVHRLDAAVSGVMVFARSAKAASILSEQIRERQFDKEYLAVVHGHPDEAGTLTDLLGRDNARRITYVADAPAKGVQEAVLDYTCLNRAEAMSRVRIRLHTGRTHQIRVQFASRGMPLVGERKYSELNDPCEIALWSYRIAFTHPKTGEKMDFTHNPPQVYPWTEV